MPNLLRLALIGFVFFGLIPLALALTSDKWFWKLPLFRFLALRKSEWDAEQIAVTISGSTIKEFRESRGYGAKVTVAHHLAGVANDVKTQVTKGIFKAFIVSMLGSSLIAFAAEKERVDRARTSAIPVLGNADAAATVGTTADRIPGADAPPVNRREPDPSIDFAVRVLTNYTLPIGIVLLIIESFTLLTSLHDQARKYEDYLDPARAKKRAGTG